MKGLSIILSIYFVLLANYSFAQKNNYCDFYYLGDNLERLATYDTIQQKRDLEKALKNKTTAAEKINLLNFVAFYNCDNQYGLKADCMLDSLKINYFERIIGKWNWNLSVPNSYGIYQTPKTCQCNRVLNITFDSLIITQNDSIIYQSEFDIISIRGNEKEEIAVKIQTNDGLYDFRDARNFQEFTFVEYFLDFPLNSLVTENDEFLKTIQLGQHNPIEIYSRKMD